MRVRMTEAEKLSLEQIRALLEAAADLQFQACDRIERYAWIEKVVGAAPHISEAWLLPVLAAMLEQFPFRIVSFHSDNGSEFINYSVSKMLNKLLIEQTKTRPRHGNDNGLAECKNGWVIRKHIGWGHIASEHAAAFDQSYIWYATPWEILRQLPGVTRYLKGDLTVQSMEALARQSSDTKAAEEMQQAKFLLLENLRRQKPA